MVRISMSYSDVFASDELLRRSIVDTLEWEDAGHNSDNYKSVSYCNLVTFSEF